MFNSNNRFKGSFLEFFMEKYFVTYSIKLSIPDPIIGEDVEISRKCRHVFDALDMKEAQKIVGERERVIRSNLGIYNGTVASGLPSLVTDTLVRMEHASDDFKLGFREIKGF